MLQELETHLSQLRQQESHIRWNKQRSGIEWAKVNNERLEQASIVLLLVSPEFLASNDCYQLAMQAQQRQKVAHIPVIPILLRPVPLLYVPFEMSALLPENGQPITEWTDRNAAFADVMQGLRATIADLSRSI